MEQVQLFLDGERDYTKIKGGTGPLVYPAAHVWIYTGLYHLTSHGKDIFLAQELFAALYLLNLAVVMSCYWKAKARSALVKPQTPESPPTDPMPTGPSLHLPPVDPLQTPAQHLHAPLLQ
jgi:hypothetical protein